MKIVQSNKEYENKVYGHISYGRVNQNLITLDSFHTRMEQ